MKITLKVKGMHCMGCKTSVEGAVKRLDGVSAAEADLAAASLTAEFDEKKTGVEKIKQAVAKAGFEAE